MTAVPIGQLIQFPEGDAATVATLAAMRRVARDAALDPVVSDTAQTIIAGCAKSPMCAVCQLRRWLAAHFQFRPDPDGIEFIELPSTLIRTVERGGIAQGDCDDVATLAAALGLAVGLTARFVVAGFRRPPTPFEHVWTELTGPGLGGWMDMDTTAPAQSLARVTRAAMMPV